MTSSKNPMEMKKVISLEIVEGADALIAVVPSKNKDRKYPLDSVVHTIVTTDVGILHCRTEPGFIFDGRSGGPKLDWYVPNLGKLNERALWHMHDCLGYGQSLAFKPTNRILRYALRDIAKYRPSKSYLVELAVGLDKSWYGTPKPSEWCYANVGKVKTEWFPVVR